jgi:hypothetical protein
MPPKHVKSVRQLIYWEYAKLIAGSAVGDRRNYRFVTYTYKKLGAKQINPSTILRENKLLVESDRICAYCEAECESLQWEHIIPKSRGGPDTIDNMVRACVGCNGSKGAHDPFEWYGEKRSDEIPRLVLGKYLKLIFEVHETAGTLDSADLNSDGQLDIYDLGEGCLQVKCGVLRLQDFYYRRPVATWSSTFKPARASMSTKVSMLKRSILPRTRSLTRG